MMTPTEKQINAAGYVRCPNKANRWYPAYCMAKRVPLWDVIVTETVSLVDWHGNIKKEFATVDAYLEYVEANGVVPEPGFNVWD